MSRTPVFDPNKKPDFLLWQHDTLVKFADEAYDALCVMSSQISELQDDVKVALKAYREATLERHL